ncbi:helix-turn-helix transcriptional regulator [Paenibacillus sp. FSL L8-0708]|uniref:helix-turn-helix transcriptional regulator n=1 Tax=Paenibacillus sp. FSL L8-0708 TaxID=2975311 RepID=UPI0030F6C360
MSYNVVAIKRKKLDLTQEKVAEMLEVSRQHYNSVENFKKAPSVDLAKGIGEILDVEWTIFFADRVNI